MKYLFTITGFLLLTLTTGAQLRLPRLVSDGMVLQRDKPTAIWGWATAGSQVTVRFKERSYGATAGADGKWRITLPPTPAGGPYDLHISGGGELTVKDILVGDVWICSGQSNMDLPIARVEWRYPGIITQANNPQIRQFTIGTRYHFQGPLDDLPGGTWESVTPATVGRFSATAYFFAQSLYEKYRIPIGLVKVSVGGTPAEAWLSEEALQVFPAHLATLQKWKDSTLVQQTLQKDRETNNEWYARAWQGDQGAHSSPRWYEPAYDDSQWPTMDIPGYWDERGYKNIYGIMWFRKTIEVPASMAGQPARLLLGTIIDRDSVFINGVFAGTTGYQYPPRRYPVPAGLLKAGKNNITIKIYNSYARGGFYKDKPYLLATATDTVPLTGAWKYRQGMAQEKIGGSTTFHYQPGGLFNGMIAPLLPMAIKGVIWYQGEANTGNAREYQQLFPALINDWRQHWQQGNFPFLYVQLANYMDTTPTPVESNWAGLREAQLKTLAVPNTGMAVTIDIGEWNDIHPLNKSDVGKRLALAARKLAYGDKRVVFSGPLYRSMQVKGNKILLSFAHTGGGLQAKGSPFLQQFAIAGADKKFVWAEARIVGNQVEVGHPAIVQPVAVRYAWANNPAGANLYNMEGLPASPFRTDQ